MLRPALALSLALLARQAPSVARDAGPEERAAGAVAPELPTRRPVAGSHGFRTLSRILFASRPDLPHRLEVLHQFPARSRWRLENEAGGTGRVVEYRAGARGFRVLPGRSSSVAVVGDELRRMVGRMELRRAALFWPDGLDWEPGTPPDDEPGAPAERRASLRDELDLEHTWGVLEARHLRDGRPGELALCDPSGGDLELLRILEWFERDGRWWPRRLELVVGGERVWSEELLEATANAYFLDLAFLPPDRRAGVQPAARDVSQALPPARRFLPVDLAAHAGLRQRFAEPLDWEQAEAAARELARRAARQLSEQDGRAIEPVVTLLLDERGRPHGCLARLHPGAAGPPPAGWEVAAERPGLLAPLRRPQEAPGILEAMLRDLPAGTRAGEPYVRGYPDDPHPPRSDGPDPPGPPGPIVRWELLLPLLPAD